MADVIPMPAPAPVAKPTPKPAARCGVLRALGLYGLDEIEPVLLAALTTGDPLLLIGPHGTAKSLLLTRVATALGLSFRHYNASLLNFDDLVGFPMPDKTGKLEYVRTPAAIWGAGAVIFDEISRCRPDIQNKLFPIIHERKVQGLALEELRFRWAAMNPPSTDEDDNGYAGSEPLDAALADRFAFIVSMPDWTQLDADDQRAIVQANDAPVQAADAQRLAATLERTRLLLATVNAMHAAQLAGYVQILVTLLQQADLPLSARRAGILFRSILAVHAAALALDPSTPLRESVWLAVCNAISQRAQGIAVAPVKLLAAHRDAWRLAGSAADDPLRPILCTNDPLERLQLALFTPQLGRDDTSRVVADVLAQLSPGARDAATVYLFEQDGVGRLNAAIAEQVAERYQQIACAPEFSESLHAAQPRFMTWMRVKDLLSRLDPNDAHDRLHANALASAFANNRLATPADAERLFNDYARARRQLGAS